MNAQMMEFVQGLIQRAPKDCAWAEEATRTMAYLVSSAANIIQDLRTERDLDGLTGLLNRRAFQERVTACLPHSSAGSLILFDVDHFKQINDTQGHAAGDNILKALGTLMTQTSRELDIVARLGGEEFGIFIPGSSQLAACQCARRLRAMIARHTEVTASFGVTTARPEDTWDTLYQRADATMYMAKKLGRNRVIAS